VSTILAHGSAGIWDEVLIIGIPLIVIIIFTVVSEVKTRRRAAEGDNGVAMDDNEN